MSYQFDRPDLGSGLIFGFFRPECQVSELSVLPTVTPGRYRFENVETGESFEQEIGEETAVVLRASEKPQSVLLHYVKL